MLQSLMFAAALALAAPEPTAVQPAPVGTQKQEDAKAKAEAAKAEEAKAKEEAEAAAKAAKPDEPQADPEIERVADGFFKGLQAGAVRKTYADMWRGTPMEQKKAELDTIVTQTETALQAYGKIDGWEPMAQKTVAPSLRQHTYLLRAAVGPLFFRLELYRKPSGWMIYRVDFADQPGKLP